MRLRSYIQSEAALLFAAEWQVQIPLSKEMMIRTRFTIIKLLLILAFHLGAYAQDWPQLQQNASRHGRSLAGPRGPYRARWIWCGNDFALRNKESKPGWPDDLHPRDGYNYPLPDIVTMTFAEGMQPVYANGVLYALDQEGSAYAINIEDGSTRWIGTNPGGAINTPVIAGSNLICASITGRITALKREDGKEAWSVETGRAFSGSPALVGNTLFAANQGGYVYSIDTANGTVKWKVRLDGPSVGGIAADESGCYLGAEDRFFYSLDAASGSIRARTQLNGQGYRLLWPVIYENKVIVQTVGAVCVGCEGVLDDVLAAGNNPQEESANILRWLSAGKRDDKWRWGGPEWQHLFVLDSVTLAQPYLVPNGPVEGCGTPAEPPAIDNQGRVLLWWRTKFPTFTAPHGGFGTKFGLDISALDLKTGRRVPIDNGRFSGQGSEADNLFAPSIGGDMLYLRQRFRGTHANNLKTMEHFTVQVESRRRDGGYWPDAGIAYVGEGDAKISTPTHPASTRTAPSVSEKMIFFAEPYCITAVESIEHVSDSK